MRPLRNGGRCLRGTANAMMRGGSRRSPWTESFRIVARCYSRSIRIVGGWRSCSTFYFGGDKDPRPRKPFSDNGDGESLEDVLHVDLRFPHKRYGVARAMKRKVILHTGPTNSGKTYAAIQALKSAKTGVYCAPLRLLAWEACNRLREAGIGTNLLTGQERDTEREATHIACTVEMIGLSDSSNMSEFDVAVIDEAQLLGDPWRGHAWTHAFLGVPASEIHLCGSPTVAALVRRLCEKTGDELEERSYERLSPLHVSKSALGTLDNVEAGDCLVAFTRKKLFHYRQELEMRGNRCSVVYGGLPPASRREQARRFNAAGEGNDVLVATDAVGMGLNLNIKRVIFTTMQKFDGEHMRYLTPCEVKQIAGRAGRYATENAEGIAMTLFPEDTPQLQACMDATSPDVRRAGLFPNEEDLRRYWIKLQDFVPDVRFSDVIAMGLEDVTIDDDEDKLYFLCEHDDAYDVALRIDDVGGLSIRDRLAFCSAPVNTNARGGNALSMIALKHFALQYANSRRVMLRHRSDALGVPNTERRLAEFEEMHRVCEVYTWLATKLGSTSGPASNMLGDDAKFPDTLRADDLKSRIEDAIEKGLDAMALENGSDRKKRRKWESSKRRRGSRSGGERRSRSELNPSAIKRARELRRSLRSRARSSK